MSRSRALLVAGLLLAWSSAHGDGAAGYDTRHAGLVVDSRQQLVWMRCSLGQRFRDGGCLGEAERLHLSDAEARIDALATADCPWRLPRFFELRGLMQPGNDRDVAIDSEAFPDTPSGWYWNQVSAGGHSQQDCFVDFAGEGRTRCNMAGQFHLRPVMSLGDAASHCLAP
ncbi:DUF1566 domain-containing protein [Halomonas sp. LR3S48]|uniref:Lcl C-terminal domain-containing protein n=1 Tax=Halomonadaceae TaxID=28256 RepID=UPI0021E4C127|nr:DUF1566 domain-containing protein [Halomonas sp. LR3S48]UYG03884.1 DUF1566 domain-containing protein [Halomonas sp. LR3S48]